MTRKTQRLWFVVFAVTCLSGATLLILNALKSDVVYFYAPSELHNASLNTPIRIGGLVETGSIKHMDGSNISFVVTDGKTSLTVHYRGMLPTLFREGQGVVAEGVLTAPTEFTATRILAKHDETYMPPEVADALKKSGHWKTDYKQ
jgi:cytochrome c-type biogenesis protein CcmE